MCFRQGQAWSPSQAHGPGPARRLLWGTAEGSAQWGPERASPDAPGPSSSSGPGPGAGVDAHAHLVPEDEPGCGRRDGSEGRAQGRRRSGWLQVQGEREGNSPVRVLVGWGKGPRGTQQRAPWGIAPSQQVPCFLSGEPGSAAAQGQGQGQCWCPAQATPTPAQAHSPAPHGTLPPAAAAPRDARGLENLLGSITKALPCDLLGESDNLWPGLLEVTVCPDKVAFRSQQLPAPGHPPTKSPDRAPELQAATRPEAPAERPLIYTFDLDLARPPSSCQEVGSRPARPPLRAYSSPCSWAPCSWAPRSTCPAPPRPREATQRPSSGPPTCQRLEPTEGQVLVFDLDTGSTRQGVLCQYPLGSRAVLVGLMPQPPFLPAPDDTPSAWPPAVPSASQNSRPVPSSVWPGWPAQPSPVPSSVSSASYREVALGPKEAKLSLELRTGPGPGTPAGVGLLPEPVAVGVPPWVGERTPGCARDPGWPEPAAEESRPVHTVWILDGPGTPDAPAAGQAQKLWATTSELAPEPDPRAPAPAVLQADTGGHSWKEAGTAHPNHPWAEGSRQGFLRGWPPLREQHPPSGQYPAAGQPPSPWQAPLPGTPLARQRSLTGPPCFHQEPAAFKELTPCRGAASTGEAGQAPAPRQEADALGLPVHVGVLRVPQAQKTCLYMSRETGALGAPPGSNAHPPSPWQPFGALRAPGEQLSLVTFATPGSGYKVLPMAMVGTAPPAPRLKLTAAEDVTDSPVLTSLGLLSGACCAPPGPSPGLRGHGQSSAAVVIDTGSGFTKCGLAGEDHVLSVVPSRVQLLQPACPGQPRYAMLGGGSSGACTVLNRGVVSDWDALEVLWQHLFYCKLGMRPEELAVLVADSPISPRTNREKVAEILFECFHVPAMQAVQQALLALYAYGRTTGLVLGSGHGTSYVAPILTGNLSPLDTCRLDVAGADLTEYLAELLLAGGRAPPKAGLVSHIKETCCYVALDVKAELARAQARAPVDFVLPDQQVVTLGSERFCCPEALFQPQLLGLSQPGLPQLALLSIGRLEARQQEQLLANVVLDGGSTLVRGFPERLRQELGPRATVLGSPHRAVAAWLGGSIMASRDSFQSLWLSRREYEEEGPWAIYKYHL